MNDLDNEIDRVWILQNRALEHLPGFVPYSREAIEGHAPAAQRSG